MAASDTRAFGARTNDYYLCPLSAVQVSAAELQRLLEPVWDGSRTLTAVSRPAPDPTDPPQEVAQGFELTVAQTATQEGREVSWTERRLVVGSTAHAQRQGAALEQRVARAVVALGALNQRKRGKKRLGVAALQAAAEQILARHAAV